MLKSPAPQQPQSPQQPQLPQLPQQPQQPSASESSAAEAQQRSAAGNPRATVPKQRHHTYVGTILEPCRNHEAECGARQPPHTTRWRDRCMARVTRPIRRALWVLSVGALRSGGCSVLLISLV